MRESVCVRERERVSVRVHVCPTLGLTWSMARCGSWSKEAQAWGYVQDCFCTYLILCLRKRLSQIWLASNEMLQQSMHMHVTTAQVSFKEHRGAAVPLTRVWQSPQCLSIACGNCKEETSADLLSCSEFFRA